AAASVVDRRFDFGPVADDASVRHELFDPGGIESGQPFQIEIVKGGTKVLALAQDRQPAQASLKPFQTQFFEQAPVVGDSSAPLVIVIVPVERVGGAPPATGYPKVVDVYG